MTDGGCEPPYHNANDKKFGGPHRSAAYTACVADGGMNGFVSSASDGRPDNRPNVRDSLPQLGDLLTEFDVGQTPNAPLVLPVCPSGVDTVWPDAATPFHP